MNGSQLVGGNASNEYLKRAILSSKTIFSKLMNNKRSTRLKMCYLRGR